MEKTRRKLFMARSLLTLLLFFTMTVVNAQTKVITGNVSDQSNIPIIGASVSVKGTTNGTITDLDGNFTLSVTDGATLEVSYIGYISQSVSTTGRSDVKITLREDTQMIDEVVVVGYGVQKKSDVTGAMVRIGSDEIKAMPVQNALQAMQGKTAGVDITSNERPGEIGNIRIRGERSMIRDEEGNYIGNSPLYVVDGIPLQNVGIENINPSDIESIDILKDASATAIYGSRGANGVVLVTTKRGKSGSLSLNYSGTMTIEKMYDRTEMMNSAEWIDFSRAAKMRAGTYGSDVISIDADRAAYGKDPYAWAQFEKGWANGTWNGNLVPNYNWTESALQTAITQEHTLSASGGTDKMQAYMSFGYLNQEGTIPGQAYERYTAKTSIDLTPTDWFKLGASMNVTYGDQEYGFRDNTSSTGGANLYFGLQAMLPWTVPYTPDGEFIRNPGGDVNIINKIRETSLSRNNRQNIRAFGSFYAQFELGKIWAPLDGLRYRMNFGPDFRYGRNGSAEAAGSVNGDVNNVANYDTEWRQSWTLDNLIYYDKKFNDLHNVGVTLLQSASSSKREFSRMRSFVNSAQELWYNMSSKNDIQRYETGLTETSLSSYMIRLNYSFADKYLLTASGRWDGSSVLAKGHKWDFFPSLALGWRLEQEDFLKDVSWLNQLKLRLGVGTTGNSAVSAYATAGAVTNNFYHFGKEVAPGMISSDPSAANPVVMANNELGWEKTTQYNLGLDFSFFNSRVSGTVDVYTSKTTDLLMRMSIPSLSGYTSTWANIGETENKGIDITLNTINVQTNDFTWASSLTFSADRNEISALPNGKQFDISNTWFVGEPFRVHYDYVYDGIWKTSEATEAAKYGAVPGQIRVKDISGPDGVPDGVINDNYDRQIVGYARPDWSGGLLNTFSYKNFDLSFFIYSRWGFTVERGAEYLSGRFAMRKLDYWIEGINEDAEYYAPGIGGENGDPRRTSMGYQDGSFIKLRNISLGYTVPKKVLAGSGLSNLKLTMQCMNPGLLYSKIDYIDPDLGGSTFNRGLVFGVNVGF